jgi:hypothetical protein
MLRKFGFIFAILIVYSLVLMSCGPMGTTLVKLDLGKPEVQIDGSYQDSNPYLILSIQRSTIGAANTRHFSMAVKKDGKIVATSRGGNDLPSVPACASCFWTNLMLMEPPTDLPYEVIVVDHLSNCRFIFQIDSPGRYQQAWPQCD